MSALSKAITPGGRVADNTPFGAGDNWVTRAGGLPTYIREVAHAMARKGKDESRAIAMAVGIVRNWAEGKGKGVRPQVRAAAAAAIAEWEAKRTGAHVAKNGIAKRVWSDSEFIGSMSPEFLFSEVHKNCDCPKIKNKKMKYRGARRTLDDHPFKGVEKREFSNKRREELKAKGKTDAHGGFPLEKPIDVKNAVSAIGRAKNPELEKKRIKAAAKKMGCTQYLPDTWNVSKHNFNPNELRDPATGKWTIPGSKGTNKKITVKKTKGGWGVFIGGSNKPTKVFSSRQAAINYADNRVGAAEMKNGKTSSGKGKKPKEDKWDKKVAEVNREAKAAEKKKTGSSGGSGSGGSSSHSSSGKKSHKKASSGRSAGSSGSGSSGSSGSSGGTTGASTGTTQQTPNQQIVTQVKDREDKVVMRYLIRHGVPESHAVRLATTTTEVPTAAEAKLIADAKKTPRYKRLKITQKELKKHLDDVEKFFNDSDPDTVDFILSGEIEKSDPDKQLVFGWCSIAREPDGTVVVDKQGDVLEDIDQMEKVAYDFVLHSRDGGEMHVRKGVSTLVESFVSTPEKCAAMGIPDGVLPTGWWVGFKVNDPNVWRDVKIGKYRMFSVHGSGVRKELED